MASFRSSLQCIQATIRSIGIDISSYGKELIDDLERTASSSKTTGQVFVMVVNVTTKNNAE